MLRAIHRSFRFLTEQTHTMSMCKYAVRVVETCNPRPLEGDAGANRPSHSRLPEVLTLSTHPSLQLHTMPIEIIQMEQDSATASPDNCLEDRCDSCADCEEEGSTDSRDSEFERDLVLCPCGDVLTRDEAVEDVNAALTHFLDAHFSLQAYTVRGAGRETDRRIKDRSRIYFALGRLAGALKQTRFVRRSGDESYVTSLQSEHAATGCNCDIVLCRDYPCCRR